MKKHAKRFLYLSSSNPVLAGTNNRRFSADMEAAFVILSVGHIWAEELDWGDITLWVHESFYTTVQVVQCWQRYNVLYKIIYKFTI